MSCGTTYLVAIQLPLLYLPLATVGVIRLFSWACHWLFEGPHPTMDGGRRVEVLGFAAVSGQTISLIVPTTKLLRYEIDLKRLREGNIVLGIADCRVLADGVQIYTAEDVKVGLFTSLDDFG